MSKDKKREKGNHRALRPVRVLSTLPYWIWAFPIWFFIASIVYVLISTSNTKQYNVETLISPETVLDGCHSACSAPFGTILGIHNGIFAYSNCNSTTCISHITHLLHSAPRVFGNASGMRWQCVEYARRYWMMRGTPTQASFASVDGAADIWDLSTVRLIDGSQTPLLKYANGLPKRVGGSAPRTGDLLIYPRQPNGFPYGHVAVIVGVTNESVFVAEQNWENTVWPAPYHNYSREITFHYSSGDMSYRLEDEATLLGWVRYSF